MTEGNVDLTIIIPFYNGEYDLIQQAINSTVQQDKITAEILVINDGSEEAYARRVREYCRKYENIRFMSQENKGVSAARNWGIKEASGKYLTFLDADDRLTQIFFSDMKRILPLQPDMILGGTKLVQSNEQVTDKLQGTYKLYSQKEDIRIWKTRLHGRQYYFSKGKKVYLNLGIAAKIIRTELAKQVLVNEDLRLCEDRVWNLEVIDKVKELIVVHQLWYLYTNNSKSVTRKYSPQVAENAAAYLSIIKEQAGNDCDDRIAYVADLCSELRRTSWQYLNHPENRSNMRERLRNEKYLYTQEPWIYLNRCKEYDPRDRKTIFLYRCRLLFLYWRVGKWLKRKRGK